MSDPSNKLSTFARSGRCLLHEKKNAHRGTNENSRHAKIPRMFSFRVRVVRTARLVAPGVCACVQNRTVS